ncbi:amidase domain-containing protein [Streptomyces sp. NPDC008159]|uniref:amidase domain-containing protein n=1 Tax=Streptomyces sp. NPDC008159 TaxID=3364817 RepID=UPI0036E79A05
MRSRTLSLAGSTVAAAVLATALLPMTAAQAAGSTPKVTKATKDAFGRVADNVITDRTAVLVGAGAARKSLKPTGGVKLSSAQKKVEDGKLSALRATKARLAALGEAYTSADTAVTVDSTKVKGTKATVKITERTSLKYKKIRGDEPASTGFEAHHQLTFTASGGTWQLTAMKGTDGGAQRINDPVAPAADAKLSRTPMAVHQAPKAATSWPAPSAPKTINGGKYNYQAMVAYTEKYWKNYNPAYRKYNSMGGDCTNYLSQGLLAGGWQQISKVTPEEYDTWYYASNGTADAWIGVNEWSWFTQTAKRTTPLANVYQMDIGDVLQVDFNRDGDKDHSMMVTFRSSSGVPYLTYHDADTYRRSVASIIASYPNAYYYAYRT